MTTNGAPPQGTGTSRAAATRQAIRRPLKARVSFTGPSGGGKTFTSLQVADVLAEEGNGRVVVLDTEATTDETASSETYADTFRFEVVNWQREWGYDPRDMVATFNDYARQGDDRPAVVVVDSTSHFWHGPGGVLSIADSRFGGWKLARPVQRLWIDAILTAPFHVILCIRAKQQYSVEESGGKQTVSKLGLGPMQDDTLEYEMQVAFTIDGGRLEVSKTRSSVMAGRSWEPNHERDMAVLLRSWLAKGEDTIRYADAQALKSAFNALPDAERPAAKEAFKAHFGSPQFLAPEHLDAAWAWLLETIPMPAHPFTGVESEDPQEADRCQVCAGRSRCRWHQATPVRPVDAPNSPGATTGAEEGGTTATDDHRAESGGVAPDPAAQSDAEWVAEAQTEPPTDPPADVPPLDDAADMAEAAAAVGQLPVDPNVGTSRGSRRR